ncbi:MAG: 16S rRNA (cytosine(1402)-N(4))-methyltransferase RsmH, partial [Kiritimatiellia bacterium]|nr:16S rRNA (cytosine(1402)-N(4))-methyltransferase RsmH [Kiritimatiellia bacterium]
MHIPVLLEETLEGLAIKPGGCYVDGTMGAGGHSEAILARGAGRLLGIDRDPEAVARCRKRLEPFAGRVTIARGNHSDLKTLAQANGFDGVDGVLLDLGVSSYQLDTPERGFSFRADGPLDMRMDCDKGQTAADWIATAEIPEMAQIFRQLGQEPQALRVAKAIDKARRKTPVQTTLQLAGIVADALPGRRGPHHPPPPVFQALRMHKKRVIQEHKAPVDGARANHYTR